MKKAETDEILLVISKTLLRISDNLERIALVVERLGPKPERVNLCWKCNPVRLLKSGENCEIHGDS